MQVRGNIERCSAIGNESGANTSEGHATAALDELRIVVDRNENVLPAQKPLLDTAHCPDMDYTRNESDFIIAYDKSHLHLLKGKM